MRKYLCESAGFCPPAIHDGKCFGEPAIVFALGKAAPYVGWERPDKQLWAGNLDSGLEIKHDPCWGMVARVFLPTRPSVDAAVHELDRQIR
jgi:hypothetical protein